MSCSICAHPEAQAITQAVARGDSYRTIEGAYGVNKSSLSRHTRQCLSAVSAAPHADPEPPLGHPTAPAHPGSRPVQVLVNAPVREAARQLYAVLVDRRTPVDTRLAVAEVVRLLLQIVQDSEGERPGA